jgi:tRNA (guanine37-N1)-methyltransferase
VPDVLLSGHHAEIRRWRRREAIRRTVERRPDLMPDAVLDDVDRKWVRELESASKDQKGSD